MKRILRSKQLRSGAWLAALTAVAQAGSFTSDFSNPAQPGLTLVGGNRANGDPYPAVANGVLAITYAENSMLGSVFFNELDPGQPVGAFTVTYKVRIGGGSSEPADGMCLYFGSDAGGAAFGEEGPEGGQGLVIGFDTYNNGDNEAPAVDVKYAGQLVGRVSYTPGGILSDAFSEVRVALKSNGTLDLSYKGSVVFTNLFIPGFTPAAGSFAFGARTGALNANHWVDDLSITTQVAGAPSVPTVQTAPVSQTVNEGAPVSFSALPAGTPPFTIQWLRNNEVIAGATSLSYSIPSASAALNGSRYAVRFQNAQGQVTSADAVLTVNADTVAPALASVRGSESFNTVTVTFSEAVTAASAGNAANYSIAGLAVSGATVLTPTTVRLATAAQTPGARYTLTVNNVADLANTPNLIAAGTTREFGAWVVAQGFLKFESFLNIGGTPVQNLLDDPKFQANAPDQSGYVATFDSRGFYPTDATENYGARISGFFTPDASGSYRFFSRSDDASQLFLSGSSDPAGLVQIAEETGCCNGFLESPATQTSEPVTLNANTRYAIQMLYKEGGGGDYGQVAVRREGDATPAGSLAPIAGRFLSTFADPDAATLNITGNPANQTGAENTRVTFSASATGTPAPLVLQWQRAEPGSSVFADLPGAVGNSYTTPILKQAADNGAKYRALARVPGRTATSTEATLTVIIDSTPPAITAAQAGDNLKSVTLSFSEAMLPAGLDNPANYTVSGVAVTAASAVNDRTVRLVTGALGQGAPVTVTAANVRDSAGNLVAAPGNSATFTSPVIVKGALKFEAFTGLGGVLPSDLRASAKFPAAPDDVRLLTTYEMNGYGDNYGARLKGFFIPPVTGDYVAYLAADDGGELWLSTDDSEANKRLVAVEPVYANPREWVTDTSADRRPDSAKINPAQPSPNVSVPIRLQQGVRYYTELIYKEGGGGDHGAAKFVLSGETPENGSAPASGAVLEAAVDPAVLAVISLPIGLRSELGSGSNPGFRVRIHQANQIGGTGLPNFIYRAEQQLAGLVDTNAADLTLASNGFFTPSGIINWNQDAGGAGDVGNFRADSTPAFPDDPIPGIPGIGSFVDRRTDNIAGELVTYVEFPAAGVYSMGVNSDDGFSVTATDQPPADNLGLYVQSGGQTAAYYAASGGTDKGGVFRPITAPLVGKLVIADPPLADAAIKNAAAIAGNIAVIDRGVNTFSAKVGFARDAGAIGVVIVNNRDPDSADGKFPIVMGGALVDLPAVMISRPQGAALKASLAAGEATARIAPDTTRYLGSFDGGRGASDSIFAFNVAQAGVYPLRLVWFEGGGGANLEWFSVTATGEKVPLNAPGNPAALKAFRTRVFIPPPPVDPTVAAAYDGTEVVITFQGKLQSSPTVDGPFTDVTATSPLRVPAASAAGNLFYRARR